MAALRTRHGACSVHSTMERDGPQRQEDHGHPSPPSTAVREPISRARLAQGTGPVGDHQVLVSAALIEEEAQIQRALQLRALPPARFRSPVALQARAELYFPPPPRRRVALGIFCGLLALVSLGLAGWTAYWLAGPLRDAFAALVG